MICQMFNLFAVKCKVNLPFGRYVLMNKITWVSILCGAGLAAFIVYVPGVNSKFY